MRQARSPKNLIPAAASGNIFVRDTCVERANCSPKTLAVDVAPDGSAPNGKAGRQVAISGDGRFVAFVSRATNLLPGNAVVSLGYWELYVRDLCVGANAPSGCTPHTEIISLGAEGEAASGPSNSPSLSADGRFIAFVSAAGNLAAGKPAFAAASLRARHLRRPHRDQSVRRAHRRCSNG